MTIQNPEAILIKQEQPTIEGLAREHAAKQGLKHYYQARARQLGLSLRTYCERFNVKGGCMSVKRFDISGEHYEVFGDNNGEYCLYREYAALEARCAVLAAELHAVEAIHNEAVFITDDHYEQCPPAVQMIIRSLAVMQIPAYQSYLAEVRAQGVEMLADSLLCPDLDDTIREFADELRKGGA